MYTKVSVPEDEVEVKLIVEYWFAPLEVMGPN
jgi:hypothetical protein